MTVSRRLPELMPQANSPNGVGGSVHPALVGWPATRRVWRAQPSGHRQRFLEGRYVGIAVAILGASWPATSLGISRLPGLRPPMCQGLDKRGAGQWKGNRYTM